MDHFFPPKTHLARLSHGEQHQERNSATKQNQKRGGKLAHSGLLLHINCPYTGHFAIFWAESAGSPVSSLEKRH